MPTTAGRPAGLFGWSMYEWSIEYSYSPARFSALTWSAIKSNAAQAVVTMVAVNNPALTTGSQIGILYGKYPYTYDKKTKLIPGPSATIKLTDLQANTVYHTAAYGIDGFGNSWIGADTLLTTGSTP